MKNGKFFSILFLIIGILLLGFSIFKIIAFPKCGKVEVTVKKINKKETTNADGDPYFINSYIVSYEINGVNYLEELHYEKSYLKKGSKVVAYYDINNPKYVTLESKTNYYIIIIFGIGIITMGVLIFISLKN